MDRKAVEQLVVEDPAFRALEGSLSRFCPFEATGGIRSELRHSNFLATVLDPMRPHGFGDRILREVLTSVARHIDQPDLLSPLGVHLMELGDAGVRREWRHIDILIELPRAKKIVAVEVKVEASQHGDQLARYRTVVEHQWPKAQGWSHVFLFLTPNDEKPEDSAWYGTGFDVFLDAMDKVGNEHEGDGLAVEMLRAYSRMMRRNYMEDRELAKLASSLWKRHRETLEFLLAHRPDLIGDLQSRLREDHALIAQRASIKGFTLEPDPSTNQYMRFGVSEWDAIPDFRSSDGWTDSKRMVLLEIARFQNGHEEGLKAGLVIGPGADTMRAEWFRAAGWTSRQVKWTWAVERPILVLPEDDAVLDYNEALAKLTDGLRSFLTEQVSPVANKLLAR